MSSPDCVGSVAGGAADSVGCGEVGCVSELLEECDVSDCVDCDAVRRDTMSAQVASILRRSSLSWST